MRLTVFDIFKQFLSYFTIVLFSVIVANAVLAVIDYYFLQRINPAYLRISKVEGFDTRSPSSFGTEKFGDRNFQLAGSPHLLTTKFGGDEISLTPSPNIDTILCNEHGKYLYYRSDLYGFRNSKSDIYENFNVMLIGDSYAMGFCEEPEDTITGHLNAAGIPTLNLGLGGAGPFTYAKLLDAFSTHLNENTSVVILSYFNNDINDALIEEKTLIGNPEKKVSLQFLKTQRIIDIPMRPTEPTRYQMLVTKDCQSECASHYKYWKSNRAKFYKSMSSLFYIRMMIKNLYNSSQNQTYDSKMGENVEHAINSTVSKALKEIRATSEVVTKTTGHSCFFFFIYANGQYNHYAFRAYVNKVSEILKDNWIIKTVTDQDLGKLHTIYRKTGGHLGPNGYEALSAVIKGTRADNACN